MSSKTTDIVAAADGVEVGLSPAVRQETTDAVVRSGGGPRAKCASALAIGLDKEMAIEGLSLTHVAKPRDVIEMLRVLDFGLLIVKAGPEDAGVWQMVEVVRRYWPQLRWALFSDNCTDQDEILARSLGAASVTGDPQILVQLAGNRRGGK